VTDEPGPLEEAAPPGAHAGGAQLGPAGSSEESPPAGDTTEVDRITVSSSSPDADIVILDSIEEELDDVERALARLGEDEP